MINLTILGVVSLALGIGIFVYAILTLVKNSNNNDNMFTQGIANLCWGAIVGSILFFSVMCFSISEHKSKSNHQCCEQSVTDSTMVIRSE